MAEAVPSGSVGKGRPLTDINMDDVKYLLSLGFSKSKVAEVLGISRKTLYNKKLELIPAQKILASIQISLNLS